MTTVDTTASSTAAASTSKSATSRNSLTANFDTFLTMLTTQLKHQDPLSPMDSTEFTNQLVQFSSVEQQIAANSNLETLIKLQQSNQTSQAISYLGETVEIPGNSLPLQGGSAMFSYTLPQNASTCEVQIKNSAGTVIYKTNADTDAGRHQLLWDGTNTAGAAQDDGIYTVSVVAKGKDGKALTPTITTFGQVTKITNDETDGTVLEIAAGSKDAKVTVTPAKVVSIAADNTLVNTQLAAANAQYQAALAQLKALQDAQNGGSSGTGTTGDTGGTTSETP